MAFKKIHFLSQEDNYVFPDSDILIEALNLTPTSFSESFKISGRANVSFFSEASDDYTITLGADALGSASFTAIEQEFFIENYAKTATANVSFTAAQEQETIYNAGFSIPATASVSFVAAQ